MRLANVFKALCAVGLTSAMVSAPATAQTQTEPADHPGRGGQDTATSIANQGLIGHALSMVIESSELLLTTKTSTYGRAYGPGVGPESRAGASTTVRAPRDLDGMRDSTRGNSTPGPADSPPQGGIRREDYRVLGAAGSPGMAGYISSELEQNALRGFEDSSRLFREADRRAGGNQAPIGPYLIAAQNYARTLKSITSGRNGSGTDSTSGSGLNNTLDIQSVCLVNHGVKKLLDATKIRVMCRLMGDGAEGTEILRQHAQQMYREGTRLIDALASSVDIPANRRAALESGRWARTEPGDNLLDAATSRSRDPDANPPSRPQGRSGTTGTASTGTPGADGAVRSDSGAGAQGPGPNAREGYGIRTGNSSGTAPARPAPVAGTQGSPMIVLARQARELVQILDELNMNIR